MSIASALADLYEERDRLNAERGRLDQAIAALEGLTDGPKTPSKPRSKKLDGRSAPKPTVICPFCGIEAKGMAGLAAHVRGSHPDRYPDQYDEWKRSR